MVIVDDINLQEGSIDLREFQYYVAQPCGPAWPLDTSNHGVFRPQIWGPQCLIILILVILEVHHY